MAWLGIKRGIIQFFTFNILGGFCLVLGLNPMDVVANLWFEPPPLLTHPATQAVLVILGAALGLIAWKYRPWQAKPVQKQQMQLRITARDAHRYLAYESKWAWRSYFRLRMWDVVSIIAVDRMRKAARAGIVHLRGRRWDRQGHEDIDPDMWSRIRIRENSILDHTNNSGETESAGYFLPPPPHFLELSLKADEVIAAWPRAGAISRVSVRLGLFVLRVYWTVEKPFLLTWRKWKQWRAGNI